MGFGRALAALLLGLVAVRYFWLNQPVALVQSVNLVFHEAGHVIFSPFGRVLAVAGGSLFEAGLPLALTLLALRDRHWTATGGCLVWLATALHSISVYAGDAQARRLPLLGGDAVVHDWWFLLRRFGVLARDQEISGMIWSAGLVAAILGGVLLLVGVVSGNPKAKGSE